MNCFKGVIAYDIAYTLFLFCAARSGGVNAADKYVSSSDLTSV